jgi:hypothetical protein
MLDQSLNGWDENDIYIYIGILDRYRLTYHVCH